MFQCDPFKPIGKQKLKHSTGKKQKQPVAVVVEVAAGVDEVVVVVVGLVVVEVSVGSENMADSDEEVGAEEVTEVDAPVVWVFEG